MDMPPNLNTLSTKELHQTAEAIGAGSEAIELARDSDDPKAALIGGSTNRSNSV